MSARSKSGWSSTAIHSISKAGKGDGASLLAQLPDRDPRIEHAAVAVGRADREAGEGEGDPTNVIERQRRVHMTSSDVNENRVRATVIPSRTNASWESMAPFGAEVVPDVYISTAVSRTRTPNRRASSTSSPTAAAAVSRASAPNTQSAGDGPFTTT